MKTFDYYDFSPNEAKINSGKLIFEQHMLKGIEGEDVFINDDKESTRVLIQNTLNTMNENKEERSIQVTMNTKLKRGDYIKYKDNNEDVTYLIISRVDNHKAYLKAKMRYCNQTLICEGQPYPIKCIADNTTYGTKGVKDNSYYEERDDRLKVWVQKNEWTDRYKENMRFIFDNKIVYEVTKINGAILDGLYIMEMILSTLKPGLDKPELNIAENGTLLDEVQANNKVEKQQINEEKTEEDVEPSMDLNVSKLHGGESLEIKVEPSNAELKVIGTSVKLEKMKEGLYKITANVVKKPEVIKILLILNNKEVIKKGILIY
ncbi:hypothetical protein JJB71_12985 [Clostridium perfringens]|uniref:hypothetical protein n=1 Tax=Clostridium perfringens TaxID=1502 RepID=UPI001ABB3A32|nr:hypothetical protein [Clostridium perfringens]MBO3398453.1 hypothetical protein [Clostridium perfringens]